MTADEEIQSGDVIPVPKVPEREPVPRVREFITGSDLVNMTDREVATTIGRLEEERERRIERYMSETWGIDAVPSAEEDSLSPG